MPEIRFARRRNRTPDQTSPVSRQEQARLLNDPAVPTSRVLTSTERKQEEDPAERPLGGAHRGHNPELHEEAA